MYIWFFCKIKKNNCVGPGQHYAPRLRPKHRTRAHAGLAEPLFNGSCLGPTRQTRFISPSIPTHDNDGPRLSCHHLIRHSTFFLSPLMPPSPRHHILDRGRRSRHLLPVFVRHQPRHRLRVVAIARPRGRFTSCVHHRFRRRRTSRSSSLPSPCSSTPTYCPSPTVAAASRLTLVDAGTRRVDHVPSLFPCVSSRRTWWRLPHLGYLSDEESRSEILDN
jgi:hypothetical protein